MADTIQILQIRLKNQFMNKLKEKYKSISLFHPNRGDKEADTFNSERGEVCIAIIHDGVKCETIMPYWELSDLVMNYLDIKSGGNTLNK